MPIPANLFLSRLPSLANHLAQGADIDSGLLDALEEAMPPKQADKLAKLLDKLLQEPSGGKVLALTLAYLLDEWMREADDTLSRISKDLDPYTWLATSDHLELVQTFRELL